MTENVPTFTAQIYMAGDVAQAKQVIRKHVFDVGLCVTVEPLDFLYTGGEEAGFRVGLINYPRFPATSAEIKAKAAVLAELLRSELGQHSFSIVASDETVWNSRHPTHPSSAHGALAVASDGGRVE